MTKLCEIVALMSVGTIKIFEVPSPAHSLMHHQLTRLKINIWPRILFVFCIFTFCRDEFERFFSSVLGSAWLFGLDSANQIKKVIRNVFMVSFELRNILLGLSAPVGVLYDK